MKDITNFINETTINESQQVKYRVAFVGAVGKDTLPISADLIIDARYKNEFDDFLNKEEGNIFAHACNDDDDSICY